MKQRVPDVYVFNPFAEGHIAHGNAFTPVKHQTQLAADLANLPQFLCQPGDIVLIAKRPSAGFLDTLEQAGFATPEFVELADGRIPPDSSLHQRALGELRPWAWGPDSVSLLKPLFARQPGESRNAGQCFNEDVARLYSKAWSAGFLRKVLARCREVQATAPSDTETDKHSGAVTGESWLCSEQEAGIVVDALPEALAAIASIRARGHHRVIVKEALGLAGHNAIRLWEPEILPAQRRWLDHALMGGRQLVVEPWLDRELDFSIQMEMEQGGLQICGYTGLVNDRKGQFLANWAEPDYRDCPPAQVAAFLGDESVASACFQRLYREIFALLEAELRHVGFLGPVSIDALIYRTPQGDRRLKPVVEINPRYTMGRLTVELMNHVCGGCHGLFRLVTRGLARREGFAELADCAASLVKRLPLRLDGGLLPKIRQGALCLNDPARAQVCLATFEVSPTPNPPGLPAGEKQQDPC